MSEVSVNITMDEELRNSLYSAENIHRLERAAEEVRTGRAKLTPHELIDA